MTFGLLVLSAALAAADTPVSGDLTTQTWTPAGSPYLVQDDVTVLAGETLTIQAGVIVRFAAADPAPASGFDGTKVELIVMGSLLVQGTKSNPVLFEAETGVAPGTWHGIIIGGSPATSAQITWAVIRHAIRGIVNLQPASGLQAADCRMTLNSDAGLYSTRGTPQLDRCTLDANDLGVRLTSESSALLTNVMIHSNTAAGIAIQNTTGTAGPTIVNCTIHSNGAAGLAITSSGSAVVNVTVTNTILSSHTTGINSAPTGGTVSLAATYCDLWANTTDISGATLGAGCVATDPQYVAAPADLHLDPASLLIGAGTSAGAPAGDFDGGPRDSPPDIGADEVGSPPPGSPGGGGGGCGATGLEALFVLAWIRRRRATASRAAEPSSRSASPGGRS